MTRTIIIRRDYLVRPRWPGSCHSTRRGAGADLLPRAHPSTSSRSTRGTRSATATSLPTARPPSASRSATTSPSASAALSRRRSASTSSASPRCVARSLEGSPCSRLQGFHVGGSERMHCAVHTRLQVCARCLGCLAADQKRRARAKRRGGRARRSEDWVQGRATQEWTRGEAVGEGPCEGQEVVEPARCASPTRFDGAFAAQAQARLVSEIWVRGPGPTCPPTPGLHLLPLPTQNRAAAKAFSKF
jgi:hypothetical protein